MENADQPHQNTVIIDTNLTAAGARRAHQELLNHLAASETVPTTVKLVLEGNSDNVSTFCAQLIYSARKSFSASSLSLDARSKKILRDLEQGED